MKEKRNLLICVVLGIIIGWIIGYLRLPSVDMDSSYFLGVVTALSFVFLCWILQSVWKKNKAVVDALSQKSGTDSPLKNYTFIWVLLVLLILLGSIISLLMINKQNKWATSKLLQQDERINQQSELLEASRRSNSLVLINDVLGAVETDLINNPKGIVSDAVISRIVALNYSFEPYRLLEADSLSQRKWSPERGQLLLGLAHMKIDSASFRKIKDQTSFSGADLREADLKGTDLSGVDLSEANLRSADLSKANISNASLSEADMWGAKLQMAKLLRSTLHRTDLRWADISGADLSGANLNGSNLNDATMRNANLKGINFEWAKLRNTDLNGSDFSETKLTGTDMASANLTKVNFYKSTMNLVNFSDAILDQTNLKDAALSKATVANEKWMQKLEEWKIVGASDIQSTYKTIDEISGKYNFRIVKK